MGVATLPLLAGRRGHDTMKEAQRERFFTFSTVDKMLLFCVGRFFHLDGFRAAAAAAPPSCLCSCRHVFVYFSFLT